MFLKLHSAERSALQDIRPLRKQILELKTLFTVESQCTNYYFGRILKYLFRDNYACMQKKKRTKKQTNTEQTQFREEKKKGNGVRK